MARTHSEQASSEGRTIAGIAAHPVGLMFGILGIAPLYLLGNMGSSSGFTVENARNALNWQISVTVAVVGLAVVAFAMPSSLDAILLPVIFGILFLLVVDFAVVLYATVKAISGEAWEYPVVPDLV